MSPNILGEARLFFLSLLTGAGLMALYDVLRIFRLLVRHKWLFIGVEDFLYWSFSGFAVFYLLYRENDGALRFYAIASVLFAMLVYDKTLSAFFLKWLKKAGRCFRINVMKRKRR